MKRMSKLVFIGICAGAILAIVMQLIHVMTGNKAYILLYNTDYIPLLNLFQDSSLFGITFHFVFCIVSVVVLFYILQWFGWQYRILPYVIVYTAGSGSLYFLTLFTEQPPDPTDAIAWFYWTASHLVFSLVVAYLVKYLMDDSLCLRDSYK